MNVEEFFKIARFVGESIEDLDDIGTIYAAADIVNAQALGRVADLLQKGRIRKIDDISGWRDLADEKGQLVILLEHGQGDDRVGKCSRPAGTKPYSVGCRIVDGAVPREIEFGCDQASQPRFVRDSIM